MTKDYPKQMYRSMNDLERLSKKRMEDEAGTQNQEKAVLRPISGSG